jgi:hypothetical protein
MPDHPTELRRLVTATGLGEIVDRYRQDLRVEISVLVTFGAIGLAGVIFGDYVGRTIGAGILLIALLVAVPTWTKSRRLLYLCTGGLLTTRRRTVVTALLRWDDVAQIRVWTTRIYQAGPPEEFIRCVLELRDGRKLNLARPPYARAERLAALIEQRVTATIHARKIAELARTGAASFGPIVLTSGGIGDGRRFVGWPDVTRIERGRVRWRVWTGGPRATISRQVRRTHNLTVLLSLAEQLRRVRPDRTTTAATGPGQK